MENEHRSSKPKNPARRELLTAALSLGLAGLAGAEAQASPSKRRKRLNGGSSAPRIDVHSHLIPDFYRTALANQGITTAGGIPIPDWSPQLAVDFMNKYGIQSQVVSISEPGVYFMPTSAERMALAQQLNDYMRDELIGATDPTLAGRFGSFAVLPLGDVDNQADIDNTCAEAQRAITQLGLDGIGLYSSYAGVYPGDRRFDPVLETLNSLGAMVFLHPVTPVAYPPSLVPTFVYEFPFDTTRAIVSLLYNGVFRRYPDIRWLVAHAGGTVPYLAYRTSMLTVYPVIAQNLGLKNLDDFNFCYSQLYYDTALSQATPAMAAVKTITGTSNILFGSDWPFSGPEFLLPGDPAPQLNQSFTKTERQQIDRGNALEQLPTLAARLSD